MTSTYQCGKCLEVFPLPAKISIEEKAFNSLPTTGRSVVETYVCPSCHSNKLTETKPADADAVEAVYVANLTTGPQIEIDNLIAQGWVITGRFSKQYILEKPKAADKPEPQTPHQTEAEEAYKKLSEAPIHA